MKRITCSIALTVGVSLFGCLDPFAPPIGAYRFTPPPVYRTLWDSVEACSSLRGDFALVRWFAVPGALIPYGGVDANGVWKPRHNIYLSEDAAFSSAAGYFTVRHEMLHDLMQGGADHSPVFRRCGLG